MSLSTAYVLLGVLLLLFSIATIWITMFLEHKMLCHNTGRFKSRRSWFFKLHMWMAWVTHFGSSPYDWSISHRMHHMFGDVEGLDPYSSIEHGYTRVFFGSAVYLHKYNRKPGHKELFSDLEPTRDEAWLYTRRKWWNVAALAVIFFIPAVLYTFTGEPSVVGVIGLLLSGVVAGHLGIFVVLIGGGLINSVAHSPRLKLSNYFARWRQTHSLDGTTAQNRNWFGYFLPELYHRNHHDRPDKSNFGWRYTLQFDYAHWSMKFWQMMGQIKIGFQPIPFNDEGILAFMKANTTPEQLQSYLRRVLPNVQICRKPECRAEFFGDNDGYELCLKVAKLAVSGELKENSGLTGEELTETVDNLNFAPSA